MASHCSIDRAPQAQGMRRSISIRFDTAGHSLKATTGTPRGSVGASPAREGPRGSYPFSWRVMSSRRGAKRRREGSVRDSRATDTANLIKANAAKAACRIAQSSPWTENARRPWPVDSFLSGRRESPAGAGSAATRCRISLAAVMRPSQIIHGSAAFLAITPPIISSENIWPTSAVRHSFSRSSVGRRRARRGPAAGDRATSLSAWSATARGSSSAGTGERAGSGQSEW